MSRKVTFTLPAEVVANATSGIILGEFNNWDDTRATSLKKAKRRINEGHAVTGSGQNLSISLFIK